MISAPCGVRVVLASLLFTFSLLPFSSAQPRTVPRPEAVAETRLLMEGLALPNFQGLNRHLQKQPAELQAWVFVRGQALLIAETSNLLMLRPPRQAGEAAWSQHAAELRDAATRLAFAAAGKDYQRSRLSLAELAHACNRCHQTFRVSVRIPPKD
jgi:hypothetical protein